MNHNETLFPQISLPEFRELIGGSYILKCSRTLATSIRYINVKFLLFCLGFTVLI